MVTLTYKPDTIFDYDLLDCAKTRKGKLKIFVNGRSFWEISEFEEIWLKELHGVPYEMQQGVPYNISIGGGSFGLKHSYHFDPKYVNNDGNLVQANYNSGFTSTYNLTGSGNTFNIGCSGSPTSVVLLSDTGDTFTLLPDKVYYFQANIINPSVSPLFVNTVVLNTVDFNLVGLGQPVQIIYNIPFTNNSPHDSLQTIGYGIRTISTFSPQTIQIQVVLNTLTYAAKNFGLTLSNITVYQYDDERSILSLDPVKENLLIQQYYDGSFIGGFQRFRLYTKPLTTTEVVHNFNIERTNFGLKNNFGGRIVYY